jgi:hypothetical protein
MTRAHDLGLLDGHVQATERARTGDPATLLGEGRMRPIDGLVNGLGFHRVLQILGIAECGMPPLESEWDAMRDEYDAGWREGVLSVIERRM